MLTIRMIWMFLWEVFMGKETVKDAYRKDRRRFFMFLSLVIMTVLFVFTLTRLINVSSEHVKLRNEVEVKGFVVDTQEKAEITVHEAIYQAVDKVDGGASGTTAANEKEAEARLLTGDSKRTSIPPPVPVVDEHKQDKDETNDDFISRRDAILQSLQ